MPAMTLSPISRSLQRCARIASLTLLLSAASGCPSDDDDKSPAMEAGTQQGEGDAGAQTSGTLKGSYTVDGVKHGCEVSTQTFPATKEFSVLCQNDDDGLVQITFKDEASARLSQTLRIIDTDIFSHPDADTINVDYRPFDDRDSVSSEDDTPGSASTKASGGRTELTLKDVELESNISDEKAKVSATVPF